MSTRVWSSESAKVARVHGLDVNERTGKGSHRRYTVGDHCSTTVSWHVGDVPAGTLNKIEEQLQNCPGMGWLRR